MKGRKTYCKISLFPASYLVSLSLTQSFLPPPSWHYEGGSWSPRVQGLAKRGLFKGPLTKTVVKLDPGSGPDAHRAEQIPAMQDLTSHHEYVPKAQRADSRGPRGRDD